MTLESKLSKAIGDSLAASEEAERKEAPRRARLEALRQSTPRVIYRDDGGGFFGRGRPSYHALRLADVGYAPARTETSYSLGSSRPQTRKRAAHVYVHRAGSRMTFSPDRLGEFVRRPTSKALRRLEEAEAELARARRAVVEAERAAFTYGKPVTLSAVRDVTRRHSAAWNGDEE